MNKIKLQSAHQKLTVLAYLVASIILLIQIVPSTHRGGFSWQNLVYLLGGLAVVWAGVLLTASRSMFIKIIGWLILLISFATLVSRILTDANIAGN